MWMRTNQKPGGIVLKEQDNWRGPLYEEGIDGQRVACVGFSHWSDEPSHEDPLKTKNDIENVISGAYDSAPYWAHFPRYFGHRTRADFWSRVVFFNSLPSIVGDGSQRYSAGTAEQQNGAQERLIRIVEKERPQKLFIFSKKAWNSLPESPNGWHKLGDTDFDWGHLATPSGWTVPVICLPHPQGADGSAMEKAVAAGMSLPVPPASA